MVEIDDSQDGEESEGRWQGQFCSTSARTVSKRETETDVVNGDALLLDFSALASIIKVVAYSPSS